MTEQTSWTIPVQKDPETGELIIEFPQDLFEQTGWKLGDTVVWVDNGDGSWTLKTK